MPEILRPIYVEKEEGVGSVLGRIQKTSEKKLALVFPPGSTVFKNVLEVEFLKKEIDKLGKQAIIITSDQAQAELAKGLGFSSSEDMKKSEKAENFLEDFYSSDDKKKEAPPKPQESEKKTTSPLVKPQMSDIVSNEEDQKEPKEKSKPQPPEPPKEPAKSKEPTKVEVAKKDKDPQEQPSPKVSPIFLTKEDLKEEASDEKPKKKKKKFRPKLSFGLFKKFPTGKLKGSPLKKVFVFLLLAAVGVFVLTATFVFPRADVTVTPARDTAKLDIDVLFDSEVKAVDFEKNIVPSQVFKMTKTAAGDFKATQEQDIQQKATGVITIYNAYSSAPQTLVKTTRFRSPEGKVFRITETITVPGAEIEGGTIKPSSIDAEVIADQAGESYNLKSADFTIPGFKGTDKYEGFYGKSTEKMTGGLISHGLVVSEDDVAKAKKSLEEQLVDDAKKELKAQLGKDFKLIEESLQAEISESTPQPAVGKPAQKFKLTLKALAQGFAYKEAHLEDLIEDKIALKISDKRITLPETQKITYKDPRIDYSNNEASFQLSVEEDISWKVAEDRLKEVLSGKDEAEAREAIKLFSEIEAARFSLWPFWLNHIPKDPRKIRLTVDY